MHTALPCTNLGTMKKFQRENGGPKKKHLQLEQLEFEQFVGAYNYTFSERI